MSIELFVFVAAAAIGGFVIAQEMLRQSSIEEMSLLIEYDTSKAFLESCWGEDEFPEFFQTSWNDNGREFYTKLARRLRGKRYGESRRLLIKLIRIEDERQVAKAGPAIVGKRQVALEGDEGYKARMAALLESYKRKSGFESILAAFIERRYTERKNGYWR